MLTGFIESSLQLSLFTGQSTDYFRIRVQQQRRGKRGKNVSQTQQIFGCIVTDQNIFLAAKNDGGDRGAGPGHYLTLDKTLDTTGHTTAGDTDDNTGTGWLHSQNILHLTFVGLVLICKYFYTQHLPCKKSLRTKFCRPGFKQEKKIG